MAEHVLALDLGSTGVRALVVRLDGVVRTRAWRAVETRFPAPGRVEHAAADLWARSREVLREALAASGLTAADLLALGVAAQRSTALAWDARSGEPLAPALSWQDRRTRAAVERLRSRGIPLNTQASCTKFEWLLGLDAVAGAAAAGRLRLGTPDVWLSDRLTGGDAFVTDPGQASCTGLVVPGERGWSEAALGLFGLEAAWLPAIVATSAVAGETPAALLGAPVPVAARAGDQQAACFAHGVHAAGEAKLTLGTSAMLDVHSGDRPHRPPAGAHALALWELGTGERAYCLEGSVTTAGAAVDWLVALGVLPAAAALDAAAAPDAGGVVFVPALEGLGTPRADPDARALLGGLTRGASRAQVVRAVIDGVAHRCVDVLDTLDAGPGPLRVDGGLTRSRTLLATLADLSGRELVCAAEDESTGLGAAWLAALAVGAVSSPARVRERRPPGRPIEPTLAAPRRAALRAAWSRALARCGAKPETG